MIRDRKPSERQTRMEASSQSINNMISDIVNALGLQNPLGTRPSARRASLIAELSAVFHSLRSENIGSRQTVSSLQGEIKRLRGRS